MYIFNLGIERNCIWGDPEVEEVEDEMGKKVISN